jgi:hypothetical protein
LTFADAAEEVRDGDSGHSQVAITHLGMVSAERLHAKAADSRCRPKGVGGTLPAERTVHFGNGHSPIMSRNQSPATAVIRGWQLPTVTGARLNG